MYRIEIPYIPTLQTTKQTSGLKSSLKGGPESEPENTRTKILKLLRENPYITSRQLADSLDMARSGISKHLSQMQETGLIKHIGPNKGGHWEVVEEE